MKEIPFSKFHGFGNDYIVIERKDIPADIEIASLALSMCERNRGVGGDGLAIIEKLTEQTADYFCEIVNPDGSIAGFSGNGTRCAVAYLHYKDLWTDENLHLRTRSGIKNYRFIAKKSDTEYWFEAEIGRPKFASEDVPVLLDMRRDHVVNEPIVIDGRHFAFSAVNVGNPVACIFVDNFDLDWRVVGCLMESHQKFPERINVVFVRVIDRGNIELRIWERGAGETAASGTCSSGAAVLTAFLLKTDRKVHVHSPGGTTDVTWRDDDEMVITGSAEFAFSGTWNA